MIKYLNLALRGSLILSVDPHRSSLDISNILLKLQRTVFTVFWWWNSTPSFPDASWIPAAECMILNSKVKKTIWVSNALLITQLWQFANQMLQGEEEANEVKTTPTTLMQSRNNTHFQNSFWFSFWPSLPRKGVHKTSDTGRVPLPSVALEATTLGCCLNCLAVPGHRFKKTDFQSWKN